MSASASNCVASNGKVSQTNSDGRGKRYLPMYIASVNLIQCICLAYVWHMLFNIEYILYMYILYHIDYYSYNICSTHALYISKILNACYI